MLSPLSLIYVQMGELKRNDESAELNDTPNWDNDTREGFSGFQMEILPRLQTLLLSCPRNSHILNICQDIIANPNQDYLPELFQLWYNTFEPLWVEFGSQEFDLKSLRNIQMPIQLEKKLLLPRVMVFNHMLLAILMCLNESKPLELPSTLIRGLLLLTRCQIPMTRLLSAALLIKTLQIDSEYLDKLLLPPILHLVKTPFVDEVLYPLLPIEFTPIFLTKSLIDLNDKIIDKIIDNKYIEIINTLLIEAFSKASAKLSFDTVTYISCSLSILNIAFRKRKECGDFIASAQMSELIKLSLERHINMANAWNYGGKHSLESRIEIYTISQGITTSCCELLVALSRSGKILRTFIKDLNLAPVLLSLLSIDSSQIPETLQNQETQIKVSTLGIIANTIIEFSNEREYQDVVSNLLKYPLKVLSTDDEDINIKEKALWVLKNALFSDNTNFKIEILNQLPYESLFELSEDKELSIKKQAFDIMRNVIAVSNENAHLLIGNFNSSDLKSKYYTFFNYLGTNLQTFEYLSQSNNRNYSLRESSQRVLQTLLYLLVHLSACDKELRDQFFTEPKILDILHVILNRSMMVSSIEWDLKTAVALIITNLINVNDKLTDDGGDGFNDDDLTVKREFLKSKNFDSLLNNLCQSTNDLDFQEKARLAVFRLSIGSTPN